MPYSKSPEGRAKRNARQKRYRTSLWGQAYILQRGCFQRAKLKGLEFSMTIAETLLKVSTGKCSVTGISFSREKRDTRRGARKANPFAPSIDRIDPAKGYTDANTRVVILAFNLARGDWGDGTTLIVAKAIVRSLQRKLH